MRDLDYLELLSHEFKNRKEASAEIINLRAICALPKGTEYFFSDLHGEHLAFIHLLRSSSGIIRSKIRETFEDTLTEDKQLELANLIYYPREQLEYYTKEHLFTADWQKIAINQLLRVCREVSHKYTRSKVRKKMPAEYAYAIDELLHSNGATQDQKNYYREILNTIVDTGVGREFIIALCELIQRLTIDSLHIIGDIFDRGPRPDIIMNELMTFKDVDIQWGNHDISWMGAAAGGEACIATVLRIATQYNAFDFLEDGYGINLRPLSMFAAEVYADDDCERFSPHMLDKNVYDSVNPELAAKMCKAISIIEFKLEGQLIKRNPEFKLESRLLLDKIDYSNGTINIAGKTYELLDTNFPTIDPSDPYMLTDAEQQLMETLKFSFMHSIRLNEHINFLYTKGSMYKVCNNNLLYHGCLPMDENGNFVEITTKAGKKSGKALMDYIEQHAISAYYIDGKLHPEEKQKETDFMWYLWCGPYSPLFGKDKITTFEHFFIDDKELHKESYNPYYEFSTDEKYAEMILKEFGLTSPNSHIINGHVPVKVNQGETPVKANGRLFIIDGGLSKAYHSKTGIAGYTLIYNSHHLALAEHKSFVVGEQNTPEIKIVERAIERVMVRDTDNGKELLKQIDNLEQLNEAYNKGLIKEKYKK